MTIPTPATRAANSQPTPRTTTGSANRPVILIIEDELNFRRVLEAKLARSGFTVLTAPDIAAGQRWLSTRTVEVVLLDLRLPDANALSALPGLRAAAGNVPFLLMTAYEEENLRARALMSGAADILYKPFDLETLVAIIRRLLERTPRFSALHVGQAVVLKRLAGRERSEVGAHVARKTADAFAVATPRPIESKPGEHVQVEVAGDDGLYEFKTTVVGYDSERRVLLAKPDVIHRRQRRERVRVPLSAPVELCTAQPAGQAADSALPVTGVSVDVSTGGIAFLTDRPVPLHERVTVTLALPTDAAGGWRVEASGQVTRSERAGGERARAYHSVVRFDALEDADLARLVAFIEGASRP